MAELRLNGDELAATLYAAAAAARGGDAPPWEHLAHGAATPYLLAARQGPLRLGAMDGESYAAAAAAMYQICTGGEGSAWDALPPRSRLVYEAMARHLAAVLDCDELDSLESLERSWGPWAERRLGPQEAGT